MFGNEKNPGIASSFVKQEGKPKERKKQQCPSLNISLNLNKNTINSIVLRNEDIDADVSAGDNKIVKCNSSSAVAKCNTE